MGQGAKSRLWAGWFLAALIALITACSGDPAELVAPSTTTATPTTADAADEPEENEARPDLAGLSGAWAEIWSAAGKMPAEVLTDYQEALDAQAAFWNPADPGHPGVDATLYGDRLDRLKEILTEHEANGWYVVEERTAHVEVIDVFRADLVRLADCQTAEPGRGIFDAEGERQEGLPDVRDGDQRNLREVRMIKDGDQWKVADVQGQEDWDCEFPPTERGLPRV